MGHEDLFHAGYHAALALVEAEIERPHRQRLTYRELAVMLRMQFTHQYQGWLQLGPSQPATS